MNEKEKIPVQADREKQAPDFYEISTDLQTVKTIYNEFFAYYLLHAIEFVKQNVPTRHTLRLLRSVNRDATEFFKNE